MGDGKEASNHMKRNSPKRIDWDGARRRVEAAGAALGDSHWRDGERGRLLRERAAAVARTPAQKAPRGEAVEAVEFTLARERYAVSTGRVREVYPLSDLTRVPCAPAFVLGIINVRGQIISVVDVKKFFNLPDKGISDLNKVIILSSAEMEFGLLADEIIGVRDIPLSDIEPALATLTGIRAEFLMGVTGERVIVLDADKLLADRNIIVHENVEP